MRILYKITVVLFFNVFCLNVFGQFTANFTVSNVTVCAGEPLNFTDLSSSPGGIVSWVWDFGDGNSSTVQNPSHSYTSAGTYSVILTVNNGTSSIDEVKLNYILVHPLPQPSFSLSNPPCSLPASVSISNVTPPSGVSYQWIFGNGQTSTVQNPPSISYTSEGTFNVQLTTTNNTTGCINSFSQAINIFNYTTDFIPSSDTVCVGSTINFTDNSTLGTNSYSWNFGNGQNSTSANPAMIYNSPGAYTVTLNSQNTMNGCSGVATQTVIVINAQQPSLTPSVTIGCNPSSVTFTNTSTFNGTFQWNFGNGTIYTGNTPPTQTYSMETYNTLPYPLSESFDVFIYSTDENGCTSGQAYPNLITIYNIVPTFTADITEGCEDLDVNFTDLSYSPIPGFPINSWQWNFGNGQTYSGQTPPTQTYSEGIYDVSLTVSTAMGCTTTVDSLTFIEVGIPPNVLFTVNPDTICARQNGIFVNQSTVNVPGGNSELEYFWYLGNQGPYSDFEPNSVPILDTGALDIMLIISFRGCNDTLVLEDEIYVHPPLVRFNMPHVLCNPEIPVQVAINDNSILGQAGDSIAVFWNLGDGTILNYGNTQAWLNNNQSFNHTYSNYGNYSIQQKIWNFDTGCVDSLSAQLVINYFALELNFNKDSICLGDTSIFHWTYESIEYFPIMNCNYVANGDSLIASTSINTMLPTNPDSCYFSTPGNHQITVNATNMMGCQASITETIYIAPLPVAGIGPIQVSGCVPTSAVFQDASTSVSGIPITDYHWMFNGVVPTVGNGFPSITTQILTTGTHTTVLQVTDSLGCVSYASLSTEFLEPVANFDVPLVICNNSIFQTTNLSTNYVSSNWYLNGQLVSTDNDGNFVISHPSGSNLSFTDDITLIVTDANGCTSELTIPIIVSAPNANFTYNLTGSNVDEFGNFACPSVFSSFTDDSESYGDIVSWQWSFGDGKSSSLQNPNNTYVFAGTYTSSLIITDEYGCQDTVTNIDYLTINGPAGTFDVGPAGTLCDPNYLFTSLTLNNVTHVEWFPGNGTSFSSISGDEYVYPTAGTYFPYVTITDNNNCVVTYYLDTLTVQYGNLNAQFLVTPIFLNWGEPLIVNNESTGGIGGIINNNWTFGNDNFNNQSDQFNYLFNEAGELQVLLITTDALGCIDSAWITVFVTDNLQFPNVFSPNGDGINDILRIRDNAYGEYEAIILNRWGNEMSRVQVMNGDYLWDGKIQNGKIANDGVYYYFVKGTLRDGTPKEDHGFFHLVVSE